MPRKQAVTSTANSSICALTAIAAFLGGCAGSGKGLDANGRPPQPGGGASGPLTADFASIQSHVFTPICTVCHSGAGAPQGLRLDATNSYSLLVGVPSTEVPSVLRVKPGDPDNSYLIQKLEGHAAVGARMPFGGPYLDQATIDVIRQWITDGAPATAAAAAARFTALVVAPAWGEVVRGGDAVRIVLGFNAELDQTRIDASSLRLERIESAVDLPADSVAVSIAVPPGDPRAILVTPTRALAAGRYRLTATAPPETGLSNIAGERLGARSTGAAPVVLAEFTVEAGR